MDSSSVPLTPFHAPKQQSTVLSQLCGTKQTFRGRYRLIQTLGRGGFGITFLARDVSLPSAPECVIKQLCPKVSHPDVLRRASERFEREAKTLAQLGSHAQIPRLLDYFEINGEFFLVQEYINGMNLAKEVRTKGTLSEQAVKKFLKEILLILEYVHRNQVIHRDIKPLNIIRCADDNRLVLIDFGAVKEQIVEIEELSQYGQSTQFVGTVGFAPPEQIALRPVYASDIYAVGVTCLYLLTGRTPMEFDCDPTDGEMIWKSLVSVSDHFGKILTKMLKMSLSERYQSAEQVLRALELEPYLDNLADCMNTKPRFGHSEPALLDELEGDRYLSPVARKAQAIRDWRARSRKKQRDTGWNPHYLAVNSNL